MVAIKRPVSYYGTHNQFERPAADIIYTVGGLRTRASKRLGLRYETGTDKCKREEKFLAALSSVEEITRQKVMVDRPLVMIKSAVILREARNSAKDMLLWEVLLAVARSSGMDKPHYDIDASLLMHLAKIDNTDRLFDALTRIAITSMQWVLTADGVKVQAVAGLMTFSLATDDRDEIKSKMRATVKYNDGKLRYNIPIAIKKMYGANDAYTWISLAAIANFSCMHTNQIYQMLAVRANMSKLFAEKPLRISAKDLARTIYWGQATRSGFNSALFHTKVIEPALKDINRLSHLTGFKVSLAPPTRSAPTPDKASTTSDARPKIKYKTKGNRGRPLDDLEFSIIPVERQLLPGTLDLLRAPKVASKSAVEEFIMLRDYRHTDDLLPCLSVFQAGVHKWFASDADQALQARKTPAYKHTTFPKNLSRAWRCALDLAYDNPEVYISSRHKAQEILHARDERKTNYKAIGIDGFFLDWLAAGPTTFAYRRPDQFVPIEPRKPPETQVFHPSIYQRLIELMTGIDKSGEDYDIASWFVNLDYVWERIVDASQDIKLGGLPKALQLMATGHPARQVLTARTLYGAVWDADFERLLKLTKSIFVNKTNGKLKLHPKTGKPVARAQLSLFDRKRLAIAAEA